MKVKVTQLGPTLCDPMDYTVHGILQARILEWVTYPFLIQELNWDLLHCRQIPGFPGIIFVVYATDTLIYIDIADVGLENQTHLFSRFCSDYSYH